MSMKGRAYLGADCWMGRACESEDDEAVYSFQHSGQQEEDRVAGDQVLTGRQQLGADSSVCWSSGLSDDPEVDSFHAEGEEDDGGVGAV